MSLRKQSFHSIIWNGAGQYVTQALSLLTAAVLGRLLDPADFGLVGMILAANAFLAILSSAGLASTVVQFKDLDEKAFSSLFGLALILGIVSGGLLIASAPVLAVFFREPRLEMIAFAWAPALFFTAAAQVPQGMLQREFLFARRSGIMIASSLIASALAIYMAFNGYGYWALVAQSVFRSILLFLFSSWAAKKPTIPRLDIALYRKVFGYTGNLTLFEFINYFHRNLDNILIGRILGAVQLGYYTRAYSLLNFFNNALGGLIRPVMHAAMAKRQDDLPALRRAYGPLISLLLWVCAPLMGVAAAFSPEIIRIVWGPSWDNAVAPFFWLAIAGMHQGVYGTIGTVFAVRYKTKELMLCGLTTTILYGSAIAYGVQFGILEVSIYYALMSWAIFFPLISYVWSNILEGKIQEILEIATIPVLFGFVALFIFKQLRIEVYKFFDAAQTPDALWFTLMALIASAITGYSLSSAYRAFLSLTGRTKSMT